MLPTLSRKQARLAWHATSPDPCRYKGCVRHKRAGCPTRRDWRHVCKRPTGVGLVTSMVTSSEDSGPPPGVEAAAVAPGSAAAGTRARVVIVGAGFGGLACARKLNKTAADVLLLDPRGYHLFTPLLYQVATALLNPSDIAYPLRTIFRKSPNVRVWQTGVTGVDLGRQVVTVCPDREIPYDYLVLATGSTENYY